MCPGSHQPRWMRWSRCTGGARDHAHEGAQVCQRQHQLQVMRHMRGLERDGGEQWQRRGKPLKRGWRRKVGGGGCNAGRPAAHLVGGRGAANTWNVSSQQLMMQMPRRQLSSARGTGTEGGTLRCARGRQASAPAGTAAKGIACYSQLMTCAARCLTRAGGGAGRCLPCCSQPS